MGVKRNRKKRNRKKRQKTELAKRERERKDKADRIIEERGGAGAGASPTHAKASRVLR